MSFLLYSVSTGNHVKLQIKGVPFLSSEYFSNSQGLATSDESNGMSQVFIWFNERYLNIIYLKSSIFLIVMTDLWVWFLQSIQVYSHSEITGSHLTVSLCESQFLSWILWWRFCTVSYDLSYWLGKVILLFHSFSLYGSWFAEVQISKQNIITCLPTCH